ncbi:MAG: integrase core domain-containing protein [Desulfitobacteriaceae bacterium]|nr:integrase core domain-containing protein [Desulfitobacteriaceae bacterium]
MSNTAKDLEILALVQKDIQAGKISKPRFKPAWRCLWILLAKFFPAWQEALVLVKPETVIRRHKTAFKFFWRTKSRKGRPQISKKTIALIKRLHQENPLLSPEKIYEQLVNLGVADAPAPNTIAKYLPNVRKPPTEWKKQSWQTFLKNHRPRIWAMDFLVVPTLCFRMLYVLLIVSHDRRKIEHFAVTTNPSAAWVAQQIREATPYGQTPQYLIHDNDSIFTAGLLQRFLANTKIKVKRTGFHAPWQNGVCERTVGILRQELLNHIIPLHEKHLHRLLREYIHGYYNRARTHQGINRQTPILADEPIKRLSLTLF